MITGKRPFDRESDVATSKAIVTDIAEPLARYKSGVPAELQRIVDRALGIIPVETPEPDDVDPLPPDETAAAAEPVDSSPADASADGTTGD